ncbi:MAG: phosphomannomutase/phosphoglucomutase [Oligoflexia bacterium]|nr:phosphomannomutase/phosphoglucomutase [Oligoflexia bacterium]
MNLEIFREYDIRGVVGKDFDASFAEVLGKAFATYLCDRQKERPLTVSIGYDARLSSPELCQAVTKGLCDSGVNVIQLGLVTTPISYFSTFTMPIHGAFMITGSHNPPEYNGFKISFGKGTIFGKEIQVLKEIILAKRFTASGVKGTVSTHDIFPEYVSKYKSDFNIARSPKVVVDCGNGAAGVIARRLYDALKINFEVLFEKPDGKFPNHHPDPTVPEYMTQLRDTVLKAKADVGIGFDGDADRIGVVDAQGRLLFGDELMVIFSRSIAKKFPGLPIIGDVKCSDRLYHDIAKHGGQPIMYKTGHSLIKDHMKSVGSKFSGEMSGHVFFADRNFGYDDAVYAGARLIEIMSETGLGVTELLKGLPPAFSTPEIRIDTTEDKKRTIVEAVRKKFANGPFKVNEIDGIRISFDDGFALVRSSNTQPVIVCRFEAQSEKRLKEIRDLVEKEVKSLL